MSLMRARPGDDYVVLELGTSSPGEIDALARVLQPDIGIVTLIGQGHLEGLGTLEGVAREKYAMLAHLPRGGLAIVHQNDHPISLPQGVRLIRHGDQPTCDVQLLGRRTGRIDLGDGRLFPEPFSGRHHAINALAVIAVAQHLGLSDATIAEGFSRATLSASRGREITHRGICFIDDSYNANPESVAASLAAFAERSTQGRRIVILGDMLELGSAQDRLHRALCEPILELHRRTPLNALVLVGPAMRALARQLEDECLPLSHHLGGPDSVRALADTLSRGDLVLLKGSRGVALERIIDHVRTRESEATAT
jgi:UDP-N-acetylmuramoyl-tripeptide--D-alanyl-D-alanine ligase